MAASPTAIAGIRCNIGSSASWPQLQMYRGVLSRAWVRCAQVPGQVATAGFIRRAHALGLDVHVWTINDRAEMIRFLDLGADGVMTDDIETLREVLIERGQWHPRVVGPGRGVARPRPDSLLKQSRQPPETRQKADSCEVRRKTTVG